MPQKPTFEESYPIIKEQVEKRRSKWTLTSIPYIDFDDIAQIIYMHIFKKWHLWDWPRPLEPWVSTVASNQISNLIKTHYSNFSRPCLQCSAFEGENLCSIYTVQCSKCPLYDHWLKTKKVAHDVNIPLPIENHVNEVENNTADSLDVERSSGELHIKIKSLLSPLEWKIYKCLYIEHKTDRETSDSIGYKSNPKGRSSGYKAIAVARKKILIIAKKIIYSGDITI